MRVSISRWNRDRGNKTSPWNMLGRVTDLLEKPQVPLLSPHSPVFLAPSTSLSHSLCVSVWFHDGQLLAPLRQQRCTFNSACLNRLFSRRSSGNRRCSYRVSTITSREAGCITNSVVSLNRLPLFTSLLHTPGAIVERRHAREWYFAAFCVVLCSKELAVTAVDSHFGRGIQVRSTLEGGETLARQVPSALGSSSDPVNMVVRFSVDAESSLPRFYRYRSFRRFLSFTTFHTAW